MTKRERILRLIRKVWGTTMSQHLAVVAMASFVGLIVTMTVADRTRATIFFQDPYYTLPGTPPSGLPPGKAQALVNGQLQTLVFTAGNQNARATPDIMGTTVATTPVAPTTSQLTLQPNFFAVGRRIWVDAVGVYTSGVTPGNLTVDLMVGSTPVAIVSTVAIPLAASITNAGWHVWGEIKCDTQGAGGTAAYTGFLLGDVQTLLAAGPTPGGSGTPLAGNTTHYAVGVATPVITPAVDTTITQTLQLRYTISVSTTTVVVWDFRYGTDG